MAIKKADICIDGRGFYTIYAQTRKGNGFMTQVQGNDRGTAYCDDSTYALNIADGAVADGLRVYVNGRDYRG